MTSSEPISLPASESGLPEQTIALVRHGETAWNRERRWQGRQGVGLNELGRQQAGAAVPLLADPAAPRWSWLVCSPLERTRQTAEIISDGLGLDVMGSDVMGSGGSGRLAIQDDDAVVERAYGEAEGMYASDAARRWPDGRFPGMESDDELGDRGATALRRIAARHAGSGIVVSHGSFIRYTIKALCGVDSPRILNGSVSRLRTDGSSWEVVEVNVVADSDLIMG